MSLVSQTTEQSVTTTPTVSNLPITLKTPIESMDITPGGTQEWVNIVEDKYRPKVGMEFPTLDKGIEKQGLCSSLWICFKASHRNEFERWCSEYEISGL